VITIFGGFSVFSPLSKKHGGCVELRVKLVEELKEEFERDFEHEKMVDDH
jgi:hypothetical protein